MHVFVAGATGVLGQRVVPLLVEAGHRVTAVGRTPAKRRQLEQLGARPVAVDLFQPEAVEQAVQEAEVICNLTTAVPPGLRVFLPGSWRAMDRIRTKVSANLVRAALATDTVGRVIQESFAPIYAAGGDAWLDESAVVKPARYNTTVLAAEEQAQRFTREGRVGIVLRFGLFYGPDDANTLQVVRGVLHGWFPLFGRPGGFSSWVAHEDAARAVAAALDISAGVYNVVEDAPLRRVELANGIARLLGVRQPRFAPQFAIRLAGPVGETMARSLRISNRKLKRAADWTPRFPTTLEGFEAIIAS